MNRTLKIVLAIAIIALVLYGATYFSKIIIYVILAALLSLIGRPVMRFFEHFRFGKFHVPTGIAAIITILLFYGLIVGFFVIFAPLIVNQVNILANIDYQEIGKSLEEPIAKVDNFMHKYKLSELDKGTTEYLTESLTKYFNVNKATNYVASILGTGIDLVTAIFAVSFIAFFFLTDRSLLYNFSLNLVPDRYLNSYDNVISATKELLSRYIFGIIIQVTLVTIIITVGMMVIGVENALLIGLFAGIVNIIPYVGPPLGALFASIVAITFNLDMNFYDVLLPMILQIVAVFGITQLIDNFIFQPYIFSNSIKAHPLEIFLVILLAGTLSGIPGMILAIPSYVILRVIAKEFLSEFKLVQAITKNI